MAQPDALPQRLTARFDEMSPQLQRAARYLIQNPQDIALLSMRELARRADVPPVTMTRLAQFMGASGYEDLRREQANTIRRGGFAARAQVSRRPAVDTPAGLARDTVAGLSAQIESLTAPESVGQMTEAAKLLAAARRVYVLGSRSCHSVAWQFGYVLSLLGEKAVQLEGAAGTFADPLSYATASDALLVISVSPYARQSLEVAALAAERGMTVIAITDSTVSPLAQIATCSVICPVESQSFFHSLVPAMAVAEVFCTLLAAQDPQESLAALARSDAQMKSLDVYATQIPKRRLRRP